jgi:ArsR family transcriptional regulator
MPGTKRTRPEGCCPPRPIQPLEQAQQGRITRVFRALADPTRLEILRLVAAQSGATCVCDIVGHFELSQPTISHHLKVLREAELLDMSRQGIWSFYAANPEGITLLARSRELIEFGQPVAASEMAAAGIGSAEG